MIAVEPCTCGHALHYSHAAVRRIVELAIALGGATVAVSTFAGVIYVPRHFAALHRIDMARLPQMARHYHWRVDADRVAVKS